MFNKKFIAIALSMLCFTGCASDNDIQQTSVSETTTVAETAAKTIAATESPIEENIVEEIQAETTFIQNEYANPEQGLVFFIQPSISQLDEASRVDNWECRDTEVLRDFHYDGEWQYAKELIFVFSNYTNEPVTIDSINIVNDAEDTLVSFTDGSLFLDINLTVQPMHKTDYILRAEDFDYSACESGIYNAVANVGLEGYGRKFFINNCEYAPTFLTEEQQEIFAKADGVMTDWFWTDTWIPPEYTDTHTTDDSLTMLYEVFTEEYANELAAEYIDENGNLRNIDRGRESDISYCDHCFLPVYSDENEVLFQNIVTHAHEDNPYFIWFETLNYRMVKTENGWRVDRFDLWN